MDKSNEKIIQLDLKLCDIFKGNALQARQNRWFTQRLMNRLPPQPKRVRVSAAQIICYAGGFAGAVVAFLLCYNSMVDEGMSLTGLGMALSFSVILLAVAGVLMGPQLVRILREG